MPPTRTPVAANAPAAAGAHVSHRHIVSAWTDSTTWLECSDYKLGHVPPSQPLVGVRPWVTRLLRTHAQRVRDQLALLARAARGGRALPVHRVPCLLPTHHLNHARSTPLQERFLAGGVAGAVSRTVVAPLERLRTILMAVRGW